MKILILNWRDIANPSGGGAEILTHEIAKRWVKDGHTVIQFSSLFPNAKEKETIDGVNFIRQGKWVTVHLFAFFYYLKNNNKFDIVIDEVHWFPFFAYLYAPKKTISLTCEVATKLFFRILPAPIAYFFLFLEKLYLSLYRKVPTMVISSSTKDDLITTGHIKDNIIILPMGITIPNGVKLLPKEKKPTLISVGRLNKQKGTVDLIEAFNIINKSIPNSRLWLVGVGEQAFIKQLKKKISDYGLTKNVTLWGFVSEQEKFDLLAKSHLLISASMQEGWGLTIPEAGYVKTPSVVYDIQGFKDIIIQKKSGILVKTNPQNLAENVIKVLQNKKQYKMLQENIYQYAQSATWDRTAQVAMKFINKNLTGALK